MTDVKKTPYQLTLSLNHRQAIDWIGNRYSHGYDLYKLLWCEGNRTPPDQEWDEQGDITFHLTENQGWGIQEIVEQDNLACFSPELCELFHFCS